MHRRPILQHSFEGAFKYQEMPLDILLRFSSPFELLFASVRQVVYVLLTRSPLDPKIPFDLHVLGMPPALILSQDQTLKKVYFPAPPVMFSFQRSIFHAHLFIQML